MAIDPCDRVGARRHNPASEQPDANFTWRAGDCLPAGNVWLGCSSHHRSMVVAVAPGLHLFASTITCSPLLNAEQARATVLACLNSPHGATSSLGQQG